MENDITKKLLLWHKEIDRDLPWKLTVNPYFIWLSEVIMQQTRVAQGTPYYLEFTNKFPTVHDLANATQEEVYKTWEGLGYYSRARNLHAAAKYISQELDGVFPHSYEEIIKLKGVGPYTAAAISSFAFGENHAVLDGNVFRVLARLFDIDTDILSSQGKKQFAELVKELLPAGNSAAFNQAIMDFGALQCTPRNPNCMYCPLQENCLAFAEGSVQDRPVKKKSNPKKHRYFHFADTRQSGILLVKKRPIGDVWAGLYELPLLEKNDDKILNDSVWSNKLGVEVVIDHHMTTKQVLSHQVIHGVFYRLTFKNGKQVQASKVSDQYVLVLNDQIGKLAFPRLLNTYFAIK